MADARSDPLADADRDEEVGEGDASLGGRCSGRVSAGRSSSRLRSAAVAWGATDGPESSTVADCGSLVGDGPDDRDARGDVGPDRPRPASPARRRGRAATTTVGHGTTIASVRPAAGQHDHQRADHARPATMPDEAPASPTTPASTTTERQTWRRRHPGRAQDADLAHALDDVHRQRVRDAERRDDHGDERERVEQPEDAVERVVDGARRRGRGSRPRAPTGAAAAARSRWVAAGASGANRTANASAPATPSRSVASDQPTSTASPPRPGNVRSAIPTTRSGVVVPSTAATFRRGAEVDAEPLGHGGRHDRGPAGIERGQRGLPIARGQRQAAVRGQVRADHRRAHRSRRHRWRGRTWRAG